MFDKNISTAPVGEEFIFYFDYKNKRYEFARNSYNQWMFYEMSKDIIIEDKYRFSYHLFIDNNYLHLVHRYYGEEGVKGTLLYKQELGYNNGKSV